MATHPALPAAGQQLVLVQGVEDEGVRAEGHRLSLEGRALVGADEEHVVPADGGRHQQHLEASRSEVTPLRPRTPEDGDMSVHRCFSLWPAPLDIC